MRDADWYEAWSRARGGDPRWDAVRPEMMRHHVALGLATFMRWVSR